MKPNKEKSLYEDWKKRHEEEIKVQIGIGEMVKGAPLTEIEKKVIRRRVGSKLDIYNVCVITPYLVNENNFFNLMQTTKKFKDLNKRMKENPIDISTPKGIKLFENINTLRIHDPDKYTMFQNMIKESIEEKQLGNVNLTEKDMEMLQNIKVEGMMTQKEIMNRKILELKNIDTKESLALVRKLEISQQRFREGYSMYDLGEVIAPYFKKLVSIKIEIDPKKEGRNNFLDVNDKRIQIKRRIDQEIEELKKQSEDILIIPGHWKRLPYFGFKNCQSREVIISPGVMVIHGSFLSNEIIQEVTIPASVMIIGYSAFNNCINLRQIHFSPRTKKDKLKLDQFCFSRTAIQEIEIPFTCQIIESQVFIDCLNLQKIRIPEELEKLGWLMLFNCINLRLIEIPKRFEEDKDKLLDFLGLQEPGLKELIQIHYY